MDKEAFLREVNPGKAQLAALLVRNQRMLSSLAHRCTTVAHGFTAMLNFKDIKSKIQRRQKELAETQTLFPAAAPHVRPALANMKTLNQMFRDESAEEQRAQRSEFQSGGDTEKKMKRQQLHGYVDISDLTRLKRLGENIFGLHVPLKKNQFYFIGEQVDEQGLKHMNAGQIREQERRLKKQEIEMSKVGQRVKPQRAKTIKQREEEALLDDPLDPMSYSKVALGRQSTIAQAHENIVRQTFYESYTTKPCRSPKEFFAESYHNKYFKALHKKQSAMNERKSQLSSQRQDKGFRNNYEAKGFETRAAAARNQAATPQDCSVRTSTHNIFMLD